MGGTSRPSNVVAIDNRTVRTTPLPGSSADELLLMQLITYSPDSLLDVEGVLDPKHFTHAGCAELWRIMLKLREVDRDLDVTTLQEEWVRSATVRRGERSGDIPPGTFSEATALSYVMDGPAMSVRETARRILLSWQAREGYRIQQERVAQLLTPELASSAIEATDPPRSGCPVQPKSPTTS